MALDSSVGVWTGLLKWSLAQTNIEPSSDAKPMSEEDKKFLKNVFETLVVDEVKRMKIICEILRMPEDEPGIKRLLGESAAALQKLHEVAPGRSEADHYGRATPAAATVAATPTSNSSSSLAAPASSPSKSPSPSSPAPPTLLDYQTASVSALAAEMLLRKEGALEELDDRCLTSDNANDFMKVGGIEPLLIEMLSKYDGLKWRAAQALSTMVQNNPKAQQHAFEHRALEYLLPLLNPPSPAAAIAAAAASSASSSSASASSSADSVNDSWTVVVKALTALSALVRSDDLPAIRESFMALGGFDKICLLYLDPATTLRAQTKLFHFSKLIWGWFPNSKEVAIKKGILPIIIAQIGRSEDIGHREACIRCLNEFAKPSGSVKDQTASKELRKKEYGLQAILQARAKELKALKNQEDKDQAEDELAMTLALIKACKF